MLDLQDVSRKFGSKYGVAHATMTFQPGKVYALLGPNGSGKTTLMKMIAGLMAPTSGQIYFEGEKVGRRSKACIAYMPTESYFYPYMTIRDAGRYYRDFFDDFDYSRFEETLLRMDLNPKDRIDKLSSGMNAKLRLALILNRNAKVMMFDEPLNGVDILTRAQVIDEIIRCRDSGRSMLISTHLVDELEPFIDHAVFMKNGVIVKEGPMNALTSEQSLTDMYMQIYAPPLPAAPAKEVAADA